MNHLVISERLRPYVQLTRLDRPIGIWLLLWPTLWALWLASEGVPRWDLLLIFVLGTVLMRSAGCAINDYADRDFDKHVKRTAQRPVTSGVLKPSDALKAALVLTLFAALLLLGLNTQTQVWALGAAFVAASYPYTKRFLAIPQAYLGIAFSFGIPMAYAAVQQQVPIQAWLIFAANLIWTVGYDTEYAMVDRDDDLKIGIRTSAITFGQADVLAVACCYALALALLVAVGVLSAMGPVYYVGLLVAAALAVIHLGWIRGRQREQCLRAFLHNTWFGAAVFAGIALDLALQGR